MELFYFLGGALVFLAGLYFGWNMGRNETMVQRKTAFHVEDGK